MKKEDNGLGDALAYIMGNTPTKEPPDIKKVDLENLGDSKGIPENLRESFSIPKVTAKRKDGSTYEMRPRSKVYGDPLPLRLTGEDREALERIAEQEGTTAAALIRRAVKELIRKGGK